MIGVSNAKKSAIWHTIAHTYDAMTVIIMDMWLWTAQIKYCHQAHRPIAGLAPTREVEGPLPGITVTPAAHAMNTGIDLDSATLGPDPVTTAIGHDTPHCRPSTNRNTSQHDSRS